MGPKQMFIIGRSNTENQEWIILSNFVDITNEEDVQSLRETYEAMEKLYSSPERIFSLPYSEIKIAETVYG